MADGSVGEAQEKARDGADRAQEGLRQQVDERSTQAGERVADTADDLRSVGEELRKQGKNTPAKLADRAAEQTERVGSYLKETGPDEMLRDVEDFGRQRPWAVLAGGLAIGVVAARFLKASSRSRYRQQSGNGTRASAQVPRRTGATPVSRAAVEPVVSPPTATPASSPAPVAPSAAP